MEKWLVYGSGPIAGLSFEQAVAWRDDFQGMLRSDIVLVNPLRGKRAFDHLDKTAARFSTDNAVVQRDHFDVQSSHVLFVNLLKKYAPDTGKLSIGTLYEMGWGHAYNKPMIVAWDDDSPYDHPFVRYTALCFTHSLEEAACMVNAVLPQRHTW